ncbi:MAG: polysaccharide deacetylase family protein, partial [Gemmatimonadaceae bacterium]
EVDLPPEMRCTTEEELSAAARMPGITLGSHSWSHPDLSQLSREQLGEELTRPLAWLRERYQTVVPYLTYPYGLSSPAVEEAARAAGYRAALRVSGGWATSTARERYALPRLNVPAGLSANGFALRASGLFCE